MFILPCDPQSPSYDANKVRGSFEIAKLPVLAVMLPVQFIPSTIPVASTEMPLERWVAHERCTTTQVIFHCAIRTDADALAFTEGRTESLCLSRARLRSLRSG